MQRQLNLYHDYELDRITVGTELCCYLDEMFRAKFS
jgi:hypothetical protein